MMDEVGRRLLLIEEVRKRKYLYDMNCRQYRDINFKGRAWREITALTKIAKPEKIFKNLRDSFLKKLKLEKKRCADFGEMHIEKWPYMQALSFLRDHMRKRNTTEYTADEAMTEEFITPINNNLEQNETGEDNNEDSNISEDVKPVINVDRGSEYLPACDNRSEDPYNTITPETNAAGSQTDGCVKGTINSGVVNRNVAGEAGDDLMNALTSTRVWFDNLLSSQDESYYFGMQVATRLRQLRPGDRTKAQIEILAILSNFDND